MLKQPWKRKIGYKVLLYDAMCNMQWIFLICSKIKNIKKNKETTNILVNQITSRKFVHKDLLMNMLLNFY